MEVLGNIKVNIVNRYFEKVLCSYKIVYVCRIIKVEFLIWKK